MRTLGPKNCIVLAQIILYYKNHNLLPVEEENDKIFENSSVRGVLRLIRKAPKLVVPGGGCSSKQSAGKAAAGHVGKAYLQEQ